MTVMKREIVNLLEKIAIYLELKGDNPFRIAAFRKAAFSLENDDRNLADIKDYTQIEGIGKGTAAIISEYMATGTAKTLEDLIKEVPEGLLSLLKIPGLGAKKIAKLNKELAIEDFASLKKACEMGKVQSLAGFGKKTEENILKAIEELHI